MKRCLALSVALASASCPLRGATHEDNDRAKSLYQRGLAGDVHAVTDCIALLESILKSEPGNQLARVYLGSAHTLRSRDLSFGPEKLHALRQGLTLMDEAANAAPKDLRVQLVRAVTNQSLPPFLGRREIARNELYYVVELVEREPGGLSPSDQQLLYLNAGLAAKQSGDKRLALKLWKRGLTTQGDPKLTADLQAALSGL